MLKIAICEDEPLDLDRIQNLVSEYTKNNSDLNISVTLFDSSKSLIERLKEEDFNIYLLDIIMDGKDGIEVGTAIRENDEKAAIIYLSSSPDYAVASYSVDAQYYLVKPFVKEKFFQVLQREIGRLAKETETYMTVRTKKGPVSICVDLILYVEQNYHVFTYHLSNDRILQSVTSRARFDQELSMLLKDPRFVKISASLIVNLGWIKCLNQKGFIMKNGAELLIARSCSDAKRRYTEYMVQGARGGPEF